MDEALRSLGAPDDCYAISTDAAIDGRSVRLADALRRAMYPTATLVCCVPGRLGFFQGEAPDDRGILLRPSTP